MNQDLKEVFKTASLIVHPDKFVFAKVKTTPLTGDHFSIIQDKDEITVITTKDKLKELDLIETSPKDRSLLEIKFSPDSPDIPGFLATISSAIAQAGISISVISTYSKDNLLISIEETDKVVQILKNLGLSENQKS